jgi:hypothetical protein
MPLAWLIVETNDSELAVFARKSVSSTVDWQLILSWKAIKHEDDGR